MKVVNQGQAPKPSGGDFDEEDPEDDGELFVIDKNQLMKKKTQQSDMIESKV
jgi:hypothetical protein